MSVAHLFFAFIVAVIWGINFIFVKLDLEVFSPLWLCALRFTLASIPAIFFIKPPALPFKTVVLYGLVMFALQFSLIFWGMSVGMTPGVAALLMQVQVFFSLFFAAIFIGEKPTNYQLLGAFISFLGIGLIGIHLDSTISLTGFLCILAGAATWGLGNLIVKRTHNVNMLALVVWGSLVACPFMLTLAYVIEGPASLQYSYENFTLTAGLSLLYIVYASTLVGYGLWNWLLNRYPVGLVVPFTLLTPVVGMLASVIFLGEAFFLWKLMAGLLMVSGLFINIFSPRLKTQKIISEPRSSKLESV